jgi:hydrogenase maturation protein HypF
VTHYQVTHYQATDDRRPTRVSVRVEGIVQGVGFRPFVRNLATELGLAGSVRNDMAGALIEVEGEPGAVGAFLLRLERDAPALCVIEEVGTSPLPPTGGTGFAISPSDPAGERRALVPADTATCEDCLKELFDPADRRYQYPFINCTNCGPRFTIVRDVPYDRPNTTMAGFGMCADCEREYRDPDDRRYHAQPTCCPACGPTLRLVDATGAEVEGEGSPIEAAAALLRRGRILAVKGLGGFHLAALAFSESAAATLRSRKHREDKPFAVMVADIGTARQLCELDEAGQRLLESPRRPIVLLWRRPAPAHGDAGPGPARPLAPPDAPPVAPPLLPDAPPDAPPVAPSVAPSVAPGNRHLGLMLPYTPLHHLLARALGEPFILTSGNVSDEPIAFRDGDARTRLDGIADAYLTHNRPIHVRTDDSVTRSLRGRATLLRRSRGYVPQPLLLPRPLARPLLACGAELKNTFCLAKGRHAFMSHHIGDLENYETLRSFTEGIEHFCRLFDVHPEVVAHDLHPEYLSTKYALDREHEGIDLVGVQHHHAHIASCLVDNGEAGPAIGVAFDGLGYGTDGALWGGEILLATLSGFERLGHLAPVAMPGGAAAIKQPWRMAAAYLDLAYEGGPPAGLSVVQRNEDRWQPVVSMARTGTASPVTSSAGRLFDAVSALVCGRDAVNYEGQAAIELEQLADPGETGSYPVPLTGSEPFQLQGKELVRAVVEDLVGGSSPDVVAARFHNALAGAVVASCRRARDLSGGNGTVALSGGVFQNVLLTERAAAGLEQDGFRVLLQRQAPANDGGISLGQAAVAGARDART